MKATFFARYIVAMFALILCAALIHQNALAEDLIEKTISWGGCNKQLGGDASGGLTLVVRPPNRSTVFLQ